MTTQTVFDAALEAYDAGLCVLPAKADGSKAPSVEWAKLQVNRPSRETTESWFIGGLDGFGVLCGEVSGQLEMLEFEGRAVSEGVFDEFLERAETVGLSDLVTAIQLGYEERTPSGGIHWLYKVKGAAKSNTKLARRPSSEQERLAGNSQIQVLIETRGEGGFTICAPSGGKTHPSGNAWELQHGGFTHITEITSEERDELYNLAQSFDQMPKVVIEAPSYLKQGHEGLRPGDVFNTSAGVQDVVVEMLKKHAYTLVYMRNGVVYMRRPGKDSGVSLSVGHVAPGYVYSWSTSDSTFDPEHSYSPFAVFCYLDHDGNWGAATQVLASQGFGEPLPPALMQSLERQGGLIDLDALAEAHFDCVDVDNGRRLIQSDGKDLHYIKQLGAWFYWDGKRWVEDLRGEVERRAKARAEAILVEASMTTNPDREKALTKWWNKSRSAPGIAAMIQMARTEPGVSILVDDLDANPMRLNVLNGSLDLSTGELQPHERSRLETKLAPVEYLPEATCPVWEGFLDKVLGGDAELIRWVQRAVGYCLTGSTVEQVLFFLHGSGANGKSTFTKTIQALLGDYALQAAPDLLIETRGSHPTGIAELFGRRFVVSQEVDDGKRFAESLVKQLTGGDVVSARRMRQDFFQFTPVGKLVLCANHKPEVRGTDYAIWRRIKLVPFTVTISPAEQDRDLGDKLAGELPGILNWALEGLRAWRLEGLGTCAAVEAATAEYRAESDSIQLFLDEECELGEVESVAATQLYERFKEWCTESGEKPRSQTWFGKKIKEKGFTSGRDPLSRKKIWGGIGLIAKQFESGDLDFRNSETVSAYERLNKNDQIHKGLYTPTVSTVSETDESLSNQGFRNQTVSEPEGPEGLSLSVANDVDDDGEEIF